MQSFLVSRGWEFCFIGGIAVLRWGEPRLTRALDLTLLTGFGHEIRFIDPLLETFEARLPACIRSRSLGGFCCSAQARAIRGDIALGGLDYERQMVSRSSMQDFYAGLALRTCSAEDLIIMKSFADRERDWADVEGVIVRQSGKLDWVYIEAQLIPLSEAKESPEILARLTSLRAKSE
jgi:hypothetical protein